MTGLAPPFSKHLICYRQVFYRHRRGGAVGNTEWAVLLSALWDDSDGMVKGQDVNEWLGLAVHDYDAVDRMYVEAETIGGG